MKLFFMSSTNQTTGNVSHCEHIEAVKIMFSLNRYKMMWEKMDNREKNIFAIGNRYYFVKYLEKYSYRYLHF